MLHTMPAIGEYGIAGCDIPGRYATAAEGQREIAGQSDIIEAESLDVLNGSIDAGTHQDAYGNQIERTHQRLAHACRAVERPGVIFRAPYVF